MTMICLRLYRSEKFTDVSKSAGNFENLDVNVDRNGQKIWSKIAVAKLLELLLSFVDQVKCVSHQRVRRLALLLTAFLYFWS